MNIGIEFISFVQDSRAILRTFCSIWQMNAAVFQNVLVRSIVLVTLMPSRCFLGIST